MAETIMHQNVDLEEHLARDWTLFQSVEAGTSDALWRSWHATSAVVVIGRNGDVHDAVIRENCGADNIPVLRRFSGGGAVVLGPGCLNYAVALSFASQPAALIDVAGSFRFILERIVAALGIPGLSIAGTDLVFGGRKVSGNAQRRGRRALIHHGTLLYDFDPGLAARYLKEPARQPAYRAARRHAEFIGNLPLSAETMLARLETAGGLCGLRPWQPSIRPSCPEAMTCVPPLQLAKCNEMVAR